MNTAVMSSSDLAKYGRWDAKFHVLMAEHKELAETLFGALSEEELTKLALALPFDQNAAEAVWPRLHRFHRSDLEKLLASPKPAQGGQSRKRNLCVYVAAASQFAVSKMLEQVLEISKQKLAKVQQIRAVVDHPILKGLAVWDKAIKRSSSDQDRAQEDGAGGRA